MSISFCSESGKYYNSESTGAPQLSHKNKIMLIYLKHWRSAYSFLTYMYIPYLASHVDHVFKSLVEVIADLKNRRQNHAVSWLRQENDRILIDEKKWLISPFWFYTSLPKGPPQPASRIYLRHRYNCTNDQTWSILTFNRWMFISACSPRYSLLFSL